MLKINLLPPERRQRARTPLPRFMILLVGVALITIEVAVGAWGYMEWKELVQQKQSLEREKKSLKPYVQTFQKLQSEIGKLEKRKKILNEIRPQGKKEKYQWSYALDQLFTVIDQSPALWIEGLKGKMDKKGKRGASSSLSLSFQTKAAEPLGRLTNFQKRMKKRLIREEKVFTNLERVWHEYSKQEVEVEDLERGLWEAEYTLERVTDKGN